MSLVDDGFEERMDELSDDYLLALSLQSLEDELNSNDNKTRKSIIESDYELALRLSVEDGQVVSGPEIPVPTPQLNPRGIASPDLELSDPNPNIWHLMSTFDTMFFAGVLTKHCIELSWSTRMTRTAGVCAWSPTTNYCSIRLSLPLLQLRSRKDLIETLIHEMIHALLFVTKEDDNHESHGKLFHEHMYRINRESGTNITVYHDFHDEVDHYLKHIWRCEGQCRTKAPYFGYVRRAMNRKPGPNDYWFKYHEQSCGGSFVKISEPQVPTKGKELLTPEKLKNKDIRSYFTPNGSKAIKSVSQVIPFPHLGHKLGSNVSNSSSNSASNSSDFKLNNDTTDVPKPLDYTKAEPSMASLNYLLSVSNVETLKSTEEDKTCDPFVPFSGRGYLLGKRKTQNRLNSGNSFGQTLRSEAIGLSSEDDIEVIQID